MNQLKEWIKSFIIEESETQKTKNCDRLITEAFDFVCTLILGKEDKVILLNEQDQILRTYHHLINTSSSSFKLDMDKVTSETAYSYFDFDFTAKNNYKLLILSDDEILENEKNSLEKIASGIKEYYKRISKYEFIIGGLNSIDEGISIADENGILLFANKSCLDITGMPEEEMVGYRIDTHTQEKPILMSVIKDGKIRIDFEYHLTVQDRTIHLINSAYPIYDKDRNISGAIDVFRSIKRSRKLADDLAGHHAIYSFENIIGESKSLRTAKSEAKAFSNSDKSIMLQGESGVGKELFAQSIHNHSYRVGEPFVAINCANLPSELIDSELFGYEDGAFTGARKQGKQGKFELANGGSVFLDEIGELPIQLQAKLLRVLETKEISRIGSNKKMKINIRIIAATNRDLDKMVKEGLFRMDLLYRLRVLEVVIPPLKNRQGDITLLAEHFLDKISYDLNLSRKTLTREATKLFHQYPWPGNIRELENVISRAVYLSKGDEIDSLILIKCGLDIDQKVMKNSEDLTTVTKKHFISTYRECGENKKKTAELLGISRPTVYRLLKKYM